MGGDRLRGRSESPGRPGKVLPSSPGPAGVTHDPNLGHHRRAGSPLSGTLAHSQRNNGSQRPQYPRALLERDGQARLWWEHTPVDVFLNTTEFHEQAATRVHLEPFAGGRLPFLACQDLAVFKAFFNRTKDWADLEAVAAAGSLDAPGVAGILAAYLGAGDERIERLLSLRR